MECNRGITEKKIFYIGLAALPVGMLIYYFFEDIIYPFLPFQGCVWDNLLGIYCPGCGGTRAFRAFLKGDFLSSFWYHPLVGYCIIIYCIYMGSHFLSLLSKGRVKGVYFRNWFLYGALIILVVNFLAKNYLRIRHGITL